MESRDAPDLLASALQDLSVNVDAYESPCPTPTKRRTTGVSPESNGRLEPCSICLSPVRPARRTSHSSSPASLSPHACQSGLCFTTPCCGKLFHRACLVRYKRSTSYEGGSRCPMCRDARTTGLTPARVAGGFVSAGAVHTAMLRRVSAARLAVQRSIAASSAASQAASPAPAERGGEDSVFFSPGAAYQEAVQQHSAPTN